MRAHTLLAALACYTYRALALPSHNYHHAQPTTFTNVTIFTPPSNYTDPGTLYARSVELSDGTLLATWENSSPEPPPVYFPVFQSKDYGLTWKELSRVQDTQNHFGLRFQPFLYLLPEKIGEFPAGTLLLSGSSIPTNFSSTEIELYASHDQGKTWEFVSHIAKGGAAVPTNGFTPVWEPFLMAYKGKLICYYSDQRANTTHGQKLVHQTTADLLSWGSVIDDAAYANYTDRPGMTTVAKLPNGRYIMTYEYGSLFGTSNYSYPVYFRISEDPEKFGSVQDYRLVVSDGAEPSSSPYVVWTPYGGANGTIVVSCGTLSSVFVNQALGEGQWKEVQTPEGVSYSRNLRILEENPNLLMLMGGGGFSSSTTHKVTVSVMDLSKAKHVAQ